MDTTNIGIGIDNNINFTMALQIDHLLELTGMNGYTPNDTPDIQTSLSPCIDVAHNKETDEWMYAALVGMIHYLSRNARPDIKLPVNQVFRHTHNIKLSHVITIKRIYWYLKFTRYEGLIFKPSNVLDVDCYEYASFAELCNVNNT